MLSTISTNLRTVRSRLEIAAQAAGRKPQAVTLIAVSKTQPATAVRAAHEAGQRDFGENYLQEDLDKVRELADLDLCWHFIGRLQSNKTRNVAAHFDWVHTVDRLRIAQRLSNARTESHLQASALNLCLQVNIDADPAKAGLAPEQVATVAEAIAHLPAVRCRGLMTILDQERDPQIGFAAMHKLYQEHAAKFGWDTLSMGMSADFSSAIAHGSTMVRIGTAIFGERRNQDDDRRSSNQHQEQNPQ